MTNTAAGITALTLFAVFAALGFGCRSREQRRRAGSTRFKGISGRIGSIERFAGAALVVAMMSGSKSPC